MSTTYYIVVYGSALFDATTEAYFDFCGSDREVMRSLLPAVEDNQLSFCTENRLAFDAFGELLKTRDVVYDSCRLDDLLE